MTAHTFCWSERPGLTLAEALQAAALLLAEGGQHPVALLYAPERCRMARLRGDGTLEGPQGATLSPAAVFEARAFSPSGELRWLHEGLGRGRAVLLADAKPRAEGEAARRWSGEGAEPPVTWPEQPCLGTAEQHYLLWGEAAATRAAAAGWSVLLEARIGELEVPLELAEGSRARLRVREYFGDVDDGHGNVALIEERLLELVPYAGPEVKATALTAKAKPEVRHD